MGIGTDVCSVARIEKTLERFGDRFVRRILTPGERARYAKSRDKAGHLAKRFAAKEAFAKAIGSGMHAPFTWQSISLTRDARGKPGIEPGAAMARHLKKIGVALAHVSLTDDAGIAVAFVVLEGGSPSPLGEGR